LTLVSKVHAFAFALRTIHSQFFTSFSKSNSRPDNNCYS